MPTHEGYSEIALVSFARFIELIKNGKPIPSVEILVDGEYRFTAIVPSKIGGDSLYDDIKTHAVALAVRSNIPLHPSVHEILNQPTVADRMAKARAARKMNKPVGV